MASKNSQRGITLLRTSLTLALTLTLTRVQVQGQFVLPAQQTGASQSLGFQPSGTRVLFPQAGSGGTRPSLGVPPVGRATRVLPQSLLDAQSQRLAAVQGSVSGVRQGSILLDRSSILQRQQLGGLQSGQATPITQERRLTLTNTGSLLRPESTRTLSFGSRNQFFPTGDLSRSIPTSGRFPGISSLTDFPFGSTSHLMLRPRPAINPAQTSGPTAQTPQTAGTQISSQTLQNPRTAANTRSVTSRTLSGLQSVPSVPQASLGPQTSIGRFGVLSTAEYQALLRRQQQQQQQPRILPGSGGQLAGDGLSTFPMTTLLSFGIPGFRTSQLSQNPRLPLSQNPRLPLSQNSLILQRQQEEIERRRQELEMLRQELALQRQRQVPQQVLQQQAAGAQPGEQSPGMSGMPLDAGVSTNTVLSGATQPQLFDPPPSMLSPTTPQVMGAEISGNVVGGGTHTSFADQGSRLINTNSVVLETSPRPSLMQPEAGPTTQSNTVVDVNRRMLNAGMLPMKGTSGPVMEMITTTQSPVPMMGVAMPSTTMMPEGPVPGETQTMMVPPEMQGHRHTMAATAATPTVAVDTTAPMAAIEASTPVAMTTSVPMTTDSLVGRLLSGAAAELAQTRTTSSVSMTTQRPMAAGASTTSVMAAGLQGNSDKIVTRDYQLLMMIERLNRQLDLLLAKGNQAANSPANQGADPLGSVLADPAMTLQVSGNQVTPSPLGSQSGPGVSTPPFPNPVGSEVTGHVSSAFNPQGNIRSTVSSLPVEVPPPENSLERQLIQSVLLNETNGVAGSKHSMDNFASSISQLSTSANLVQGSSSSDPMQGMPSMQSKAQTQTNAPTTPHRVPASVGQTTSQSSSQGSTLSSTPLGSVPQSATAPNPADASNTGFDLRTAINNPVFFNLLEAHLHNMMSKGMSFMPQQLSSPAGQAQTNPPSTTLSPSPQTTAQVSANANSQTNPVLPVPTTQTTVSSTQSAHTPTGSNSSDGQTPIGSQASSNSSGSPPSASVDLVLSASNGSGSSVPAGTAGGAGHALSGSLVAEFNLRDAVNDPVFFNLLEAHLHRLMSTGGSLVPGAGALQGSTSQVAAASASTIPSPPITTGSLAGGQAVGVTASSTLAPTVLNLPIISQQDAFRAFVLTSKGSVPSAGSSGQTSAPGSATAVNFNLWESAANTAPASVSASPGAAQSPVNSPLPVVTKTNFHSMQALYGALQLLKATSSPTVMLQIKHLLQMFPPQQGLDLSKFQPITEEQLTALGIPVTTQVETKAVGSSINALAQVYAITVDQLMQLLGGKSPNQIATVGPTTQSTATGTPAATPTMTAIGTTAVTATTQSTTPPLATTLTPLPLEPTEVPEPGDPGFIDHFFKVGKALTAEDLLMLKQQMAELSGAA